MQNKKLKKALQITAFIAIGSACLYQQLTHNLDFTISIAQPDNDTNPNDSDDSPAMQHALDNNDNDTNTNADNSRNNYQSLSSFGQRTFKI